MKTTKAIIFYRKRRNKIEKIKHINIQEIWQESVSVNLSIKLSGRWKKKIKGIKTIDDGDICRQPVNKK